MRFTYPDNNLSYPGNFLKMMFQMAKGYGAKQIRVLEGLEGVQGRQFPGHADRIFMAGE